MIRGLRWWIVVLLFFGAALNYLDRNVLAILEPKIQPEIGWTPEQWGLINGMFWLSYAGLAFVAGRFLDRVGAKLGYGLMLAWWGAACALHGVVGSVFGFMALRFVLGVGEAGVIPATAKATAEWFPKQERGLAYGLAIGGMMIAGIAAPPITGALATSLGWRWAFFTTGGTCALWLAGWSLLYGLPAKHRRITQAERDYILSAQEAERREREEAPVEAAGPRIGMLKLIGRPQLWGIAAARFLGDPVWAFYMAWTPKYMADARGLDFKTIANIAWLPFVASAAGSIASGWISSFLIKRGMEPVRARKAMLIGGAALMPVGSLAFFAESLEAAMGCLCVAGFGHIVWVVATQTLPSDMFPGRYVGAATGAAQTTGSIGNVLALYGVGYVVSHFSYLPVFILAGLMHPIGTVLMLVTVRNTSALTAWIRGHDSAA